MRAEVYPKPDLPGHAVLRLLGLDAAADGVTLLVERRQGPERFLSETGWQRSEAWLLPEMVDAFDGGLDLHVGPRVCDMVAGTTVRVALREPAIGNLGTTVVPWPAMQTSGAHDPDRRLEDDLAGRTDKALRAPGPRASADIATRVEMAPRPEELPSAFPDPALPLPEARPVESMERPSVLSQSRTSRSNVPVVLGLLLLALVVAGGGAGAYWGFYRRPQAPPTVPKVDPKSDPKSPATTTDTTGKPDYVTPVRKQVDDILAAKPTPDQMVERGRQFLKAGQPEGAFLLWRQAADGGFPPAAFELAGLYDPVNPVPNSPFKLNAERAAGLYETAARAGIAPAMRRLGQLYAKGGEGLPADKTKARDWLSKAVEKGDAEAKQALADLK